MKFRNLIIPFLIIGLCSGCINRKNTAVKEETAEEKTEEKVEETPTPTPESTANLQAVTGDELTTVRRLAVDAIIEEIGSDAYKGLNDSTFQATTNGVDTMVSGEYSCLVNGLLTSVPFQFIYTNQNGEYVVKEKQTGSDVVFEALDATPEPANIDDDEYELNQVKIKEDGTRIWVFDLNAGYFTANAHHSGEGNLRIWITDMNNQTVATVVDQGGDYQVSNRVEIKPGRYKIWIKCTGGNWGVTWDK